MSAETFDQLDAPVVYDLDETAYHAHAALSSSGARKMLPPSCPAIFHHERQHPPKPKKAFDLGSGVHKLVLGAGPELRIVEAKDWRTKAAKAEQEKAREASEIPVLAHEYEQACDMAGVVQQHPVAGELFREGQAEVSLFWRDDRSGVDCRARLDWIKPGGKIVDFKTTNSADPVAVAKSVANYGYHQQGDWYIDGVLATGLATVTTFRLVCQSKTPPYPVTVVELDREALRVGAARNRRARAIYAQCEAAGVWPAHAEGVVTVGLPAWATRDGEPEEPFDEAEVQF